jgi:hypothetical protein
MSGGYEPDPARRDPHHRDGRPVDRALVARLLGDPTDQVGSVNDPRTREEHGLRWNEKWIYRAEHGLEEERLVFWYRYDFLGAFRVKPDGTLEPESLPGA